MKKYEGNIVNIFDNSIFFGEISVFEGRIFNIVRTKDEMPDAPYFLPGFVDAHVHIESSMLAPSQFGKMAVVHGTVGTVSDPHEIANVLGTKGVEFMIENGEKIPFKFCFGAPSCVPATEFETSGAIVSVEDIEYLMAHPKIGYLAEMMNFPGVIYENEEVLEKLAIAKKYHKPIDGHAPGLRGEQAQKYFSFGISTDHECFSFDEAKEKLEMGVKVLIREGSAAKNFNDLISLANEYSSQMMFCSDDKHPDDLVEGHINLLVKRAVESGVDVFKALRMASLNPVRHYDLNVGLLREGEPADFIEVNNLLDFKVISTYIDGNLVASKGASLIPDVKAEKVNNFNTKAINPEDLILEIPKDAKFIKTIKVNDGQLITDSFLFELTQRDTTFLIQNDILKLVVYNRYKDSKPMVAFINGFRLKNGAIASSVAHDSHNIIAVGTSDEDIAEAINLIVREKGGISVVADKKMGVLPLPIAGLMSDKDGYEVAKDYTQIDEFTKTQLNCLLKSPFMSLSFMALLVIPSLKLSDKGLFDGNTFKFTSIFE
ncbi:adenine deaminase [Lacihabitans soyangensis]|uniref:Adenine deaminase n=1 Tax=Lacihabitans soyangensis TaxID=869394 RepID=A0AAE3GYK8_9BACT|nr:adenine deaminase [Lacihabitans soyangensis]MCP9761612.1 adenine deaminase [Lacihabitans soyangensis]